MNDIGKILNYLYFLFWHKALLYVNISERGVESIHNILCVVYVDNSRYFETGGNRWGPHIPQGNIYLTALRVSLLIMKYLLFLLRIMIFQKIFILRTVFVRFTKLVYPFHHVERTIWTLAIYISVLTHLLIENGALNCSLLS